MTDTPGRDLQQGSRVPLPNLEGRLRLRVDAQDDAPVEDAPRGLQASGRIDQVQPALRNVEAKRRQVAAAAAAASDAAGSFSSPSGPRPRSPRPRSPRPRSPRPRLRRALRCPLPVAAATTRTLALALQQCSPVPAAGPRPGPRPGLGAWAGAGDTPQARDAANCCASLAARLRSGAAAAAGDTGSTTTVAAVAAADAAAQTLKRAWREGPLAGAWSRDHPEAAGAGAANPAVLAGVSYESEAVSSSVQASRTASGVRERGTWKGKIRENIRVSDGLAVSTNTAVGYPSAVLDTHRPPSSAQDDMIWGKQAACYLRQALRTPSP